MFLITNTYFRLLHARARRATVDDLMAPRATPPAVTFPLPARQWPTSPSTLLLLRLLLWRADRRHKYDSDLFYERGCAHYLRMRIWSALTAPPRRSIVALTELDQLHISASVVIIAVRRDVRLCVLCCGWALYYNSGSWQGCTVRRLLTTLVLLLLWFLFPPRNDGQHTVILTVFKSRGGACLFVCLSMVKSRKNY